MIRSAKVLIHTIQSDLQSNVLIFEFSLEMSNQIWARECKLEFVKGYKKYGNKNRAAKMLHSCWKVELKNHSWVFPRTLSYHCFCVPNRVYWRPKAFSVDKDIDKSAGAQQNTVSPLLPVDPRESFAGGPIGKSPENSAYFGSENLLL